MRPRAQTAFRWVWTLRSKELLGSLQRLKRKRQVDKNGVENSLSACLRRACDFLTPASQVLASSAQIRHYVVNYGEGKEDWDMKGNRKQSRRLQEAQYMCRKYEITCLTTVLIKKNKKKTELSEIVHVVTIGHFYSRKAQLSKSFNVEDRWWMMLSFTSHDQYIVPPPFKIKCLKSISLQSADQWSLLLHQCKIC